jgi:nucleolar protein 53
MEPSKEAPRQFKQPSRKGKKAWRKNVDLTEVQEGLEAVRQEIIQGYDYVTAFLSQILTKS